MRRMAVVCVFAVSLAVTGFAQSPEWQRMVAEGAAAERAGNLPAAVEAFKKAARIAESGPPTMNLASNYNALAILYKDIGQPAQAIRQYRRALAVIESVRGKQTEEYAVVLANLGTDLTEDRQYASAEKMIREAIAIYSSLPGIPEHRLGSARNSLGELLLHTGRLAEAEVVLQQALAAFRKDPPLIGKIGATMNNLAGIRRTEGRNREAVELLQECVSLIELDSGRDHYRLIRPLNNLATTYTSIGQPEAAEPVFQRALAIAEARLGLDHPLYAQVLLNYSDCVKARGDKKQAKILAARARQLLEDHSVASGHGMTVDVSSFR